VPTVFQCSSVNPEQLLRYDSKESDRFLSFVARVVLITGGAGFIGSHLAERLFDLGYKVRVIDNLSAQVHSAHATLPRYLQGKVEFVRGDILNKDLVREAVTGVDYIIHLAAETGVGQSMYQITRYIDTNIKGSAVLLESVIQSRKKVGKIVVASSRAVYGEGKYLCRRCGVTYPTQRSEAELARKHWQMNCPRCGLRVEPKATDEEAMLKPTSIYAITKQAQEQVFSVVSEAYGIPTVILRYFNVYGPRQSLGNPYTGILSIFASRIISGKPPLIYEDGLESRDFVHVNDAVAAMILALEKGEANNEVFNVGSGTRVTISGIANLLLKHLGSPLDPVLAGKYRVGDIRHCFADIGKIGSKLGYEPSISIEEGISNFARWVKRQKKVLDLSDEASGELSRRKLLRQI
jgi:dTDP-L-rhamnose 4-epimerase